MEFKDIKSGDKFTIKRSYLTWIKYATNYAKSIEAIKTRNPNKPYHKQRYFDDKEEVVKEGETLNDFTEQTIIDEIESDLIDSCTPTGEIVGLLNHWRNKYVIKRRNK